MTARNYFYNESLARVTSANTTFSSYTASITFTGTNTLKYVIFWCAYLDTSPVFNGFNKARLQNTTTTTTIAECDMFPEATSARVPVGGAELYTGTGSPTTIRIEFCSALGTTTTGISESCILILELGANDVAVESTGDTAGTGSYVTKVTTGSFGSAGDYLIIGSAKVVTNGMAKVRLNNTTTQYETIMEEDNVSEIRPYFAMRRETFAGAQTHTLDFANATGTNTIRNARIFALRMSDFDNYYWAEDRTQHTSTSSTYADSTCAVTATPLALDHLILACGQVGDTTGTQATFMGNKVNDGTAGAGADIGTVFSTLSSESTNSAKAVWIFQRKITPSASPKTWTTRYNRASGTATMASDEHVLAVLQLNATPVAFIPPREDPMQSLLVM